MKRLERRIVYINISAYVIRVASLLLALITVIKLFISEPKLMIVLVSILIIGITVEWLRLVGTNRTFFKIEKELSYKTPHQVLYDLRNKKVVCFRLSDDAGFLRITNNELILHTEKMGNSTMVKNIEDDESTIEVIKGLMEITPLFKNGVLFNVKEREVSSIKDLLDIEREIQDLSSEASD